MDRVSDKSAPAIGEFYQSSPSAFTPCSEKVSAQRVVMDSHRCGHLSSLLGSENAGFLRSPSEDENSVEVMCENVQVLNALVEPEKRKSFHSGAIAEAFVYPYYLKAGEKSMCDRFLELMSEMSRLQDFNTPEGKTQFAIQMLSLIAFMVEDPTGEAQVLAQMIHKHLEAYDCDHLAFFNKLCSWVKNATAMVYRRPIDEEVGLRPKKGFLFVSEEAVWDQTGMFNLNIQILKNFVSEEDKRRFDAINLKIVFRDSWKGAELMDMMGSLSVYEEFHFSESKNELALKLLAILELMQKNKDGYEAVKAFVLSPEYEDDVVCLNAITAYLNFQNPETPFPVTIRAVSTMPKMKESPSSSERQRRLKKEEFGDVRAQSLLSFALEQQSLFERQCQKVRSTYTFYS